MMTISEEKKDHKLVEEQNPRDELFKFLEQDWAPQDL